MRSRPSCVTSALHCLLLLRLTVQLRIMPAAPPIVNSTFARLLSVCAAQGFSADSAKQASPANSNCRPLGTYSTELQSMLNRVLTAGSSFTAERWLY